MVIDNSGFSAVYCSGLGSALSLVGVPDVGLMTETETVFALRYIVDAVKVPVIGDGADGFGNAINTMRTVRDFIRAGVAGMHIDDQVAPSR
jgi:2-methylisocitrate lyase-like PEP mutase family enzyme